MYRFASPEILLNGALLLFVGWGGIHPMYGQTVSPESQALVVARNVDVAEDLVSISRPVVIRGVARRNVICFGAPVSVEGIVRGDVAVIGGGLEIRDGGIVYGNVIVIGGMLQRGQMGRIDGRIFATSFYQEALIALFNQPTRELFSVDYSIVALGWRILRTFTWFLVGLVLVVLWPNQVGLAAHRIRSAPGRVTLIGLLTVLALASSLFLFLVLCAILIGVPLLILWIVFSGAAWIFGSTAFFYFVGRLIGSSILRERTVSISWVLLFGVLASGLLGLIPLVSFLLPLIILILGLGAVMMTKFGTGTSWRRSLSLAGD